MPILQKTVPWQRGYDFGVGADLASGSPMDKAVTGDITQVQHAGGSTVSFEVQRIRSTSDLEQALNISVDASYGSALFGAGVEARFNFAKKSQVQSASLFMSVTGQIDLPFMQIDEPVLTQDASDTVSNPTRFADRFGNVFVRGIARGGFFVGVLRIETATSTDTESIAAALQGTYGLFSADAQANFAKIQSQFHAESFVQMYHEGGPPDLAITDVTDPTQLLTNVNLFLKSFDTNPDSVAVAYEVTLAPMIIARGPPPLNEAQIEQAQDVLTFCARQRSALLDQLNLLLYIASNPFRYDYSNGANEQAIRQAAIDTQFDIDTIANCAAAAINHPENAALPADFAARQRPPSTFPKAVVPSVLPVAKPVPLVVPDWVGQSYQALMFGDPTDPRENPIPKGPRPDDVGLKAVAVEQDAPHDLDGIVLSTDPPKDTPVARGTIVHFVVGAFNG